MSETNTVPVYVNAGDDDEYVGRFTLDGLERLFKAAGRVSWPGESLVAQEIDWILDPDLRARILYS